MLQQLKSAEKTLILATSKPLVFAKQILDFFKLDEYFDYFSGSELDGRRSRKGEVIAHALDQVNISDLSSVLMVGDREHDVIGAKENGIDCAGVLYGYGSRTELLSSGVNYLAENPEELLKIILTPHKT